MLLPDDTTLLLAASPLALLGLLWAWRQRRLPPPAVNRLPPPRILHPAATDADPLAVASTLNSDTAQHDRASPDALQLEIGVADTDQLTEADVYLQFGYLDRAAALLRSYADQHPPASRELARLLGLYLRLAAIDDFTEILGRLAAQGMLTEADTAQAVVEGLRIDPDNLALRVFAEDTLSWDIATVSRRVGLAPPQPAPRAASAALAAHAAAPASGQHLVQGSQPLAPLADLERQAICYLLPPRQSVRILQQHGEAMTAIRTLEGLLAQTRHPLTLLMDILHLYYRQADLAGYCRRLWQSFVLLGEHGSALRERLLRMGFALGRHPLLDALATTPDSAALEALGRTWGLVPVVTANSSSLPLVTAHPAGELRGSGSDALADAEAYLDYGQVDEAQGVLEQALYRNPADVRLYPPLLDLYQRRESVEPLRALLAHVRATLGRPPAEVAPRLAQLRQLLKLDDPLEEQHVCQHPG